jgi:general stress protein 26
MIGRRSTSRAVRCLMNARPPPGSHEWLSHVCREKPRCTERHLRSRPMALQGNRCRWRSLVFSGRHSPKVNEISYVSISGNATLVDDKRKAAELWSPAVKAWFPKGLDDPELLLLKVSIEQAEYWDNPGGMVTTLIASVKGLATGQQPKVGENKTVKL